MKPAAFALALTFALPVTAIADPAPAPVTIIDAGVQLRAADGTVAHDLRLATVVHQCAESRATDGPRSFEVELCHRSDNAAGRVVQIKWSMHDGKRAQRHEGWAVLAAGATIEVGAARGKGDTLIVSVK